MRDLPKSTATPPHVVKKSSEIVRLSSDHRRQPGARSDRVPEEDELDEEEEECKDATRLRVVHTQQQQQQQQPAIPPALFVSANTIPGRQYHGDSVRLSKTFKDVPTSSSTRRKHDRVGHYPSTSTSAGGKVAESRDIATSRAGSSSLCGTGSPPSLLSTASEDEEILEFISHEINVSDGQTASSSGSSSSSSSDSSGSESFSSGEEDAEEQRSFDDEMLTSTELQGKGGGQVATTVATAARISSCEGDDTTTGRGGVTINQSKMVFSSAPAPFRAPVGATEMMKIGTTAPDEERSRIPRFKKGPPGTTIGQDDSTCCDDDFTWVRTQGRGEAPKASVESDRRSSSRATTVARSVARDQHQRGGSVALTQPSQPLQRHSSTETPGPSRGSTGSGPSGKPPRPLRETGGSLDRRRHLGSNRHERDSKSRSTHSLKEKSSSSEFPKHESMSSNVSLNSKEHHHDSGSYNHYNSSGSGSQHHHPHRPQPQHSQRQSPSIWEPPPPPPLSHWDPHYYWGYQQHHQHQSREELRLIDHYHRRQQELYRYGSSSALGSSQDLSCAGGCCNRNYYPPPPPLPSPGGCCSCDHHRSHWNTDGQRQDTDERLRRLQTDKEALALQVKTLTEQVQTFTSKISELERTVKEKNQLLANAEDLLQRVSVFANTVGIQIDKQKEMLSRSSLETQKLELMSAMSELKLQQAALERENLELRTNFVTSSSGSMGLMNGSLTNGTGTAVLSNVLNNNSITPGLLRRPQIITNTRMVGMSASTPGTSLTSSPMHHGSHGSLPQPAISPITPKTPPATYRQRVDVHYSSLPRQAFATTLSTVSTSSGSSTATDSNANPKRNVAFGKCLPTLETYLTRNKDEELEQIENNSSATVTKQSAGSKSTYPPIGMSSSMDALALAAALRRTEETNLMQMKAASCSAQQLLNDQTGSGDRPVGARTIADLAHSSYQDARDPIQRANTEPPSPKGADDDNDGDTTSNTPMKTLKKSQEKPSTRSLLPASSLSSERQWHEPIDKRRGFSVPNLAETENASDDRTDSSLPPRSFTPQPAPSPSMSNKLKTIFGKIKRSNSGTLDDLSGAEGEFKRGGVRATAGARLGWSGTAPYRQPDKPFREWPLDALCHWFDHLGLGMYEEDLRRWLGTGSAAPAAELLKASPVDVEKELNLRHPLHRKKIVLALADIGGTEEDDELFKNAGKLDTAWILRWLEDVGLPQYRDTFTAARIDGRMLHKLTMDDLVHLQVSSCLHVASLRRAIQVMRSEKWNADCLVRRPLPPDASHAGKDEVRLWTALRVHEWLRAVDLAEYSPNLRGSGVHGALMVFEVKFTAELFADLLSIPSSKTLLRRHLATHFKDLLGRDVIQVKREAENTLGFQPLTISAKIKTPKKSQFSLKRKKSTKGQLGGEEWSDYVCPMGGSGQEAFPVAASASAVSSNHSAVAAVAANAFTSNASSANTNNVTSIGMMKNPSAVPTAYPDSTTSSSTSTTTSGVGSEHASHPHQPPMTNGVSVPLMMMMINGNGSTGGGSGGAGGSDSPTSTRSSTTSTS
ncbi:uncharacterized protein LOC125954386 isoform X3 [Anopheles darlingi]|uniref:uncharacterized protein LOC125954386 isoform X3 n=1 Tax=Anopheles darlingi TaxID=43151 RepID=UPI0021005EFA|nr:uncharacterized protein LOC125954386 isoform X3 [Anopheles darlingi]